MTTPTTTETVLQLQATDRDTFIDEVAPARELDARTTDGITVALLWRPDHPDLLLRVDDARTGVRFELDVPRGDALEAFHHPFAYAA